MGQGGGGGPFVAGATALAVPYGLCSFCSPPVATNQSQIKTAAAAAVADAGAVFYQVGATGVNAVQHYK